MKRAIQLAVLTLGVVFLVPTANAQKTRFTATLAGSHEVPAVQSTAHGRATFQLGRSGKSIFYTVTVDGIDNVTMAHIHMGASGKNGPPIVWLYPAKAYPVKMGKRSGLLARGSFTASNLVGPLQGKTIADLMKEMRKGDLYVNVHTKAHPDGEIRGKIE